MRHDTDPAWYIADLEAELAATKEKLARADKLADAVEYVMFAMEWDKDCDLNRALKAYREVGSET